MMGGCGFISGAEIISLGGLGRAGGTLIQFVQDLHDAIAAHDRIVEDKFEHRGVFQDDGLGHHVLDAGTLLGEAVEAALLLVRVAEDADVNGGGFQIAGAIHVVDRDETDVADVELAPDGFADGALEQLADSFKTEV
jgi:hypothetical protein